MSGDCLQLNEDTAAHYRRSYAYIFISNSR